MADDFLDLISQITNYIQNERVSSFNEGADEATKSVRDWMVLEGVRMFTCPGSEHESIPDLLNEIKDHFAERPSSSE